MQQELAAFETCALLADKLQAASMLSTVDEMRGFDGDDESGDVTTTAALPGLSRYLDQLVCSYPSVELQVKSEFLFAWRGAVDEIVYQLMHPVDEQGSSATLPGASSPFDATATARSVATEHGLAAIMGTLQTEHREEKLAVLGDRLLGFWNTWLPTTGELWDSREQTLEALASCDPFNSDEHRDLHSPPNSGVPQDDKSAPDAPRTEGCDGAGMLDVVSSSLVSRQFSTLIARFDRDVVTAMERFESTKFPCTPDGTGHSTSFASSEQQQPFHGGMPEVRSAWKQLSRVAFQYAAGGKVLAGIMRTRRADRERMMRMLELGCFDDTLLSGSDPTWSEALGELSVLRSATARLEQARLTRLLGTSRALDNSEAEKTLSRIQFERARQASAVAAASVNLLSSPARVDGGKKRDSLAQPAAAAVPLSSSTEGVGGDQSAAGRRESETFADGATIGTEVSGVAAASSAPEVEGAGTRTPLVLHVASHKSIIPPHLLVDLEMVARAYHLAIPSLRSQSSSSRTGGGGLQEGEIGPMVAGKLPQWRNAAAVITERRRKTIRELFRQRSPRKMHLFQHSMRDVGFMTMECRVTERCTSSTQTHLVGTVHLDAVVKDLEAELATTRAALQEHTQLLLLERQRSATLMNALETLQRLSRDSASGRASSPPHSDKRGEDARTPQSPHRRSPAAGGAGGDNGKRDEASSLADYHAVGSHARLIPDSVIDAALRNEAGNVPDVVAGRGEVARNRRPPSSLDHHHHVHSPPSLPRDAPPPPPPLVGPVIRTFLVGRARCYSGGRTAPKHDEPGSVVASTTSLAELPSPLAVVPTAEGRDDEKTHPHHHHQRPPSVAAAETLAQKFGKDFANKMRNLADHRNKLLRIHTTEDVWSEKKNKVDSVTVPPGIDPRVASALRNHPPPLRNCSSGEAVVSATQGDAQAAVPTASTPALVRPTHYGTVAHR